MKYTSYINLLSAAALLIVPMAAFSQSTALQQRVARAVAQAAAQEQQLRQATVSVHATLVKPIKMSDVMFRRPRCNDQVISYDKKEKSCQGILAQGERRVFVPVSCVTARGYTLSSVQLKFANNVIATGTQRVVSTQGDLSYIRVAANSTRGLQGLPMAQIPAGKSLCEQFGEAFETYLLQFFRSKGVPAKARRCRIGSSCFKSVPQVQVGDAVMYNGKVVALVKDIPHTFSRGFLGGVSEKHLAIIR